MGGHDRAGRDRDKGAIMINVPQEIIDEYLRDSTNKELIIKHDGIDPETINYYTGDIQIPPVGNNSLQNKNCKPKIMSLTKV